MPALDTPKIRTCGTMAVHERLMRTDPNYIENRNRSENAYWQAMARGGSTGRVGITTIPVVVHVVWNTAAQNISDAQVQSQIAVLNRDFRATNPDRLNTPAVFTQLIADSRIQFQLASVDPSGNATNGITRTQTTSTSFSDDDHVKSAASGGVNAWPRDHYLNIWVCQLGGGLLGYAQFPGGAAATDGVVIRNSAFGTNGTAASPFNLGRTATHEIGHWLNARHIWGDDGNGCNGSDFVADTPNAAGPNTGKPAFPHVSCNNGPNGDLFMNYMDYTDDDSMFMFTQGQVARMQTCLDNDRPTIGVSATAPSTGIWPNGSAYFFDGTQYSRYDVAADKVMAGYPKPIAGNWPGLTGPIDAVVLWNNGKAYFFKGSQYIRYDVAADKADAGYPKPIAGNWPGLTGPIDAVVLWNNGKAYFFKGSQYIRYDVAADKADAGYPKPIAGNWPGFPATFAASVDAVVLWNNGKAYFFKGSQYIRYDVAADKVDAGYPKPISAGWPGLFTSNIDA